MFSCCRVGKKGAVKGATERLIYPFFRCFYSLSMLKYFWDNCVAGWGDLPFL